MKRSDLTPGEAYYYARGNDWATPAYGDGRGAKAVVVDDERYTINRSTWGFRNSPYSQDPKGTAVLVDIHYTEHEVRREAVPAAHLRGPYEQTAAQVAGWVARRDARRKVDAEARLAARDRSDSAITAAKALGVSATGGSGYGIAVTVPTEVFAAMIEALAAAGWRYEKTR